VEVSLLESNAALGEARAARHELRLAGFSPVIPDAWTIMFTQFDSRRAVLGRANNWSFYRNPEYDAFNDQANRATNPRLRASIYRKMQEIIHRDAIRVDIADIDNVVAMRNVVQSLKNDPGSSFYMQYVWMKK
jgi:peptide/nickel transport system substrate-binding protein